MDSLNETEHQSKKVSAHQKRAQYQPKESQFDPSQIETEKVQLWSDSGIMRGVIPVLVAKRNVESRSCFVISPQAIQELPIGSKKADAPAEVRELHQKLDTCVRALMSAEQAYQDFFEVMPVAWQTYDNIITEAIDESGLRESIVAQSKADRATLEAAK